MAPSPFAASVEASESFPMSRLCIICQSIGASPLAPVLPINQPVQLLSRVWLFVSPWIAARQAFLAITNSRSPSSQWCHPAISSSVVPFSFCPQSLPASESFPMSLLFAWGGQSTGVSALASFLPKYSQGRSSDGLVGYPCSPRDSQESSPTPQFKSINSSALSFLHSPTLTSIYDHWKNHSLD